ncbi:MAG: hypothetical protein ACLR8P_04385 [Clostridium fessum]
MERNRADERAGGAGRVCRSTLPWYGNWAQRRLRSGSFRIWSVQMDGLILPGA